MVSLGIHGRQELEDVAVDPRRAQRLWRGEVRGRVGGGNLAAAGL